MHVQHNHEQNSEKAIQNFNCLPVVCGFTFCQQKDFGGALRRKRKNCIGHDDVLRSQCDGVLSDEKPKCDKLQCEEPT